MSLSSLKSVIDLCGQILFLSLCLKVSLFVYLFGQILENFLRLIFQFFDSVDNFLFIGNNGDHFLFHSSVSILKLCTNFNIFCVFLNQSEHFLKYEVKDGIMLQFLCVFPVIKAVDSF